MSIYEEIMRAQVKQGNMGGRNGPLGYVLRESKKKEKVAKVNTPKPPKPVVNKSPYTINLVSGTVTNPTDNNGFSDPYLVIMAIKPDNSFSKHLFKSNVCKKTLTPTWNQSEDFVVGDNITDIIVELWDHDVLSKNDFIGRSIISMNAVRNTGYDDTLQFFNGSEAVEGTVKLSIKRKQGTRF
ncbi:hypothetical protein ACTA71_002674 [Dictyostelium dimigraforme]